MFGSGVSLETQCRSGSMRSQRAWRIGVSVGGVSGVRAVAALPGLSGTTGSTVALQAQLLKQRAQLADWESCVSAKTPEGKAHIEALSRELAATQSQIRKIEAAASLQGPSLVTAQRVPAPGHGGLDVWA